MQGIGCGHGESLARSGAGSGGSFSVRRCYLSPAWVLSCSPDGSYPAVGRSLTYRCGAFHALADVTLRKALPEDVRPEQVRCALAAVMARTLDAAGTFDEAGWLRIGLAGHQPSLGESYISTGSLYLCTNAFLPLGLPAEDRFWSGADLPWTSKKVWSGEDLATDHAISG